MQQGLVIGTATATVKHPSMNGQKLLVVKLLKADGKTADGEPVLVIDQLGAGAGETVIVSSDGKYTRELVGSDKTPVRWCVIGVEDSK